jgi:hypothetical protein
VGLCEIWFSSEQVLPLEFVLNSMNSIPKVAYRTIPFCKRNDLCYWFVSVISERVYIEVLQHLVCFSLEHDLYSNVYIDLNFVLQCLAYVMLVGLQILVI